MLRNLRQTAIKTVGTGILVVGSVEFTTKLPSEGRSSQTYHDISDKIVTPFIRKILNPEGAKFFLFQLQIIYICCTIHVFAFNGLL